MTLGHIDPFLSIITCEQNLNSSFLRRTFAHSVGLGHRILMLEIMLKAKWSSI